jgi:D-cysteine desulfhydrase family pyridoxal phosphate-dependent enzyme
MKDLLSKKAGLGFFPTPFHYLSNLSNVLGGPEIYIKRDDLTGLALGGNKTRKLNYLMAKAITEGADTVISAGAAQSNHCRQTAAAAAQLGLQCHLVLGGQAPELSQGNLLLDELFDAHIHWTGDNRKGEDISAIAENLAAQGKKVSVIPYGGSDKVGARGFVDGFIELNEQVELSEFSTIVFASSSGGTHAGLEIGKQLTESDIRLQGINIDKDEEPDRSFVDVIVNLCNQVAKEFDVEASFTNEDITLSDDYIADGYGIVGAQEREALSLLAKLEGIILDPVYTGRAMAGLIDMVRKGHFNKGEKVIFWHTGGAPAVFAYADDILD